MKLDSVVPVILLFSLSTQTFAICDQERNEYLEWNSKCETLSAASQVAGTAGGIFAIVTFGASMVPCAAACMAARNACRIKDEKKQNLEACEKRVQESPIKEQARQARIEQINAHFADHRKGLIKIYEHLMQEFVDNMALQGFDIEDPESKELIRVNKEKLEKECQEVLDEAEQARKQKVANA